MKVVLVTRKNCHLCEEALSLLDDLGLEPELRDVDAESDLHSMYDWRVPVVLVDGRVVAEGRIDRDHLREAMSAP
jgi:predicted thioredoxin/glutaredoxin